MIELRDISKSYGQSQLLASLSFTIQDGEFFVLVGPSGSGKTTILKMLNRLLEPSQGEIFRDGKNLTSYDLRELRLETGYVLQQIALFPNLTVAENIALIPEMKGWEPSRRKQEMERLLERVGLPAASYANRYPKDLSGGEQQRVGILRAIIAQPKVLLMDEPFSALDPLSRKQLQKLTRDLQRELGLTIVFVTHDMKEAMDLADRICILHEGQILQLDRPEVIRKQPQTAFVASLFEGS